ncbi:MAG TPA: M91 family zinc metallopeptidase [Kofleriaceae bacterium]|nr:M91 family zinc metallopeptidase [Kofleriaceae bacterium]
MLFTQGMRGYIATTLGLLLFGQACSQTDAMPEPCTAGHDICEAAPADDALDSKADGSTVRLNVGDSIVIIGFSDAAKKVKADLEIMRQDPLGKEILAEFEAAAKAATPASGEDARMVLRALDDLNPLPVDCGRTYFRPGTIAAALPVHASEQLDRVTIEEAGKGVAPGTIRVYYNRNCTETYSDGAACFEPWYLLAHELLHATHGMTGQVLVEYRDNSDPMPGGSNHEEAQTIGRGGYVMKRLTENALRTEHDLPVRDSHGKLCGPR